MSAASGVRRAGYVAVAALMAGCYPALDWREVTVVEAGFVVLLPSRPSRDTRQVRIGPHTLSMTMLSARADGFLYGVGYAKLDKEIGTPAQAALLDDARTALLANFGANLPHASGDHGLPPWRVTPASRSMPIQSSTIDPYHLAPGSAQPARTYTNSCRSRHAIRRRRPMRRCFLVHFACSSSALILRVECSMPPSLLPSLPPKVRCENHDE